MEVGATCVGSIVQTYKPNTKILKGDEKVILNLEDPQ